MENRKNKRVRLNPRKMKICKKLKIGKTNVRLQSQKYENMEKVENRKN